jgi:hypothetical protein
MSKNNEPPVDLSTELVYFDGLIKVLVFIDQERGTVRSLPSMGSDKRDKRRTFSLPQGKKQGRFKKGDIDFRPDT